MNKWDGFKAEGKHTKIKKKVRFWNLECNIILVFEENSGKKQNRMDQRLKK
jgi:hypothetical protein